jgi:hypothetical protein
MWISAKVGLVWAALLLVAGVAVAQELTVLKMSGSTPSHTHVPCEEAELVPVLPLRLQATGGDVSLLSITFNVKDRQDLGSSLPLPLNADSPVELWQGSTAQEFEESNSVLLAATVVVAAADPAIGGNEVTVSLTTPLVIPDGMHEDVWVVLHAEYDELRASEFQAAVLASSDVTTASGTVTINGSEIRSDWAWIYFCHGDLGSTSTRKGEGEGCTVSPHDSYLGAVLLILIMGALAVSARQHLRTGRSC